MPPRPTRLGGPLSIEHVVFAARSHSHVSTAPAALRRMAASRGVVDAATSDGEAHYGINTGFGSLSQTRVPAADLRDLQRNLVRSHAAGIGPPLPGEVVRATMLLLAASLARGNSGVRPVVATRICDLLNAGITPVVPEVGSVGASGDLAPLAHIALVLIGEGEAFTRAGRRVPGARALRDANLAPLTLEAKEGLALINGTHLMAARAALLCHDTNVLFEAALVATAMSIDA
ncbi:MAG: aromatic amino acid lyase, partial [Phycisphaerales bacterium]